MVVRNKIWEEFKQAKANVECIARYTSIQRQLNCIYQVFIAVTAAVGTVTSGFYIEASVYALGAIAIVSLAKAIFPQIIQPENELCALDGIMDYYNSFMNKLEDLFYEFDKKQKTEDEVMVEIFNLKEEECKMQSQMNKLIRWIPNFMQNQVNEKTEEYIKRVYYGEYEQNNDKQQPVEGASNSSDSTNPTATT